MGQLRTLSLWIFAVQGFYMSVVSVKTGDSRVDAPVRGIALPNGGRYGH